MDSATAAKYRVLWAKSNPRHPLWKHLLDAAAVSLALPNPLNRFGWRSTQTALIVGLHDIGKADASFQHQVAEFSEELHQAGFLATCDARCRHERLSARFFTNKLKGVGFNPYAATAIARAILAHHGYWDEGARDIGIEYANAQVELCGLLEQSLEVVNFPNDIPSDLSAFGMQLAGHIVLCDWIASNEKFFTDGRLKDVVEAGLYFTTAKEIAREWVIKLGLERSLEAGKPISIVNTPRPIQNALLENNIPPGLVIIEAPMGEGKTEAAWILAEKWRDQGYHGMYMALPTMATSDSLHARYREGYLDKLGRGEDTKLVHGMAWLRDEKEPEKQLNVGESGDQELIDLASAWFRPTRRAMLAAHGVGTVDQAMLAGMHVKFGFLRLYGLIDRILVIDEVHAYDAYMSAIIARLLQWCACLKIPVVLLSATLSAKQRVAMLEAYGATGSDPRPTAPYPLITIAQLGQKACMIEARACSTRTLRIQTHPGLLGEAKNTAALASNLIENGGCCCVILNTVKQAQAVYKELKHSNDEKLLFHARFTAENRERIANQVLTKFGKDTSNRPHKFVLVATQVVEQSLDVDFDHMISEIAPIDLLLQRSGRLHRHGKRERDPVLHVLQPETIEMAFGGTGYVYAEKPLLRTLAILAGKHEARLPDDFRGLIEHCYGLEEWEQDAVAWAAIREADVKWNCEIQSLHHQGRQFALCQPSKRVFRPVNNAPTGDDSDDGNGWRATTRLGANDHTAVLVPEEQLRFLEDGELRMDEVRELYRRCLKLPAYVPIYSPAGGYSSAVEAKGKLRGLILLPLAGNGRWRGIDERGNHHEVAYHEELGLLAGRLQ